MQLVFPLKKKLVRTIDGTAPRNVLVRGPPGVLSEHPEDSPKPTHLPQSQLELEIWPGS